MYFGRLALRAYMHKNNKKKCLPILFLPPALPHASYAQACNPASTNPAVLGILSLLPCGKDHCCCRFCESPRAHVMARLLSLPQRPRPHLLFLFLVLIHPRQPLLSLHLYPPPLRERLPLLPPPCLRLLFLPQRPRPRLLFLFLLLIHPHDSPSCPSSTSSHRERPLPSYCTTWCLPSSCRS